MLEEGKKGSGRKGGGSWKTGLAEEKTEEERQKSLNRWLGKDKDLSLLGRSWGHKAGKLLESHSAGG